MDMKVTFKNKVSFHPGRTLEDKLKEMSMSIKEFALRTSKPEKTIHAVIKGESSITSDMAVAFETVTKIPANFWMNKQRSYDEYQARLKREAVISESCEWARQFPYAAMVKLGWVASSRKVEEKVNALFSYFQISTVNAWEDYYYKQQLKVVFRISLYNVKEPFAISAWLRQGEIQAAEVSVEPYSEKLLKEAIPQMKEIMLKADKSFPQQLQALCAQVGVKLIYTPCLPKAPISGSTRWINDTPVIQLSGRNKKYDAFWFTFFHEIGHILLHGKKDIFLEEIDYSDKALDKEAEANQFAAETLLPLADEQAIVYSGVISLNEIKEAAAKYNVGNSLVPIIDLFGTKD